MKATKIRNTDGTKPAKHTLEMLCDEVVLRAGLKGYITEAEVIGETSVKIGLHMRSFRIDTAKIGHNARIGRAAYGYNGCKSPKGYKRTDVPTWDQRVEFNNIVNAVFSSHGLKANIVSGAYTVRYYESGAVRSWNFGGDRDAGYSGHASEEIMTEAEAREMLNSDKLEAEHKAAQREERREKSRAYRQHKRQVESAKFVALNFSDWKNGKYVSETRVLTLKEVEKINAKRYRKYKLTDLKPLMGKTRVEATQYLMALGTRKAGA